MRTGAVAFALALCLAPLCGACSFLPSGEYREARSFDIGVPAPLASAPAVSIQPFGSDSACKYKMLYRSGGNEVFVDEYNKWTQPPGQMLTKYLRLAFRNDGDGSPREAKYELGGSVLAFEADFEKKKVELGVRYSLRSVGSDSRSFERSAVISEPLSSVDPAEAAKAMGKAAFKLAVMIDADLKALDAVCPVAGK